MKEKPKKSWLYIPDMGAFNCHDYDELPEGFKEQDDIINLTEEEFRIGQSPLQSFANVLQCKKCNGKQFNVAQDEYLTAIRCINCKWELCIHES